MRIPHALFICATVPLVTACASYTEQSQQIRSLLTLGSYDKALEKLDKSEIASSDRDKVLYHMERGTVLYSATNYSSAVKDWALASKRVDELYTVSISRTAASLAISDSYADFEGETHEKVLLPVYSALAYFANNDLDKAIVEARRTNHLLGVLHSQSGKKNTYARDSFAHFLTGLIYEGKRDWDDAIIEYRNALDAEKQNEKWLSSLSSDLIAESLGRLAEFRNRRDILSTLEKSHPKVSWTPMESLQKSGEVFVVYEAGRSPIKIPQDIVIPVQGNIMRISFPTFKNSYYASRGASILVNGSNQGRTLVLQDIGALAKQALADRRVRDIAKMTARVVAKDQTARAVGRNLGPLAQLLVSITGAVTETADTRSWTSLPDTIQVRRLSVPSNQSVRVVIQPDAGKAKEFIVSLRPGEKKLLQYRTFD